jgi:hypothetical protein
MKAGNEEKSYDEEDYRALVAKLKAEIKKLQKENKSLQNDLDERIGLLEDVITSIGNPNRKITDDAAKYIFDKYMLDTYHEGKTKPIKKR